jgi:hypothetical protein
VTLPAGTTVHVVASDPDGDALTYVWSKLSGTGTPTFAAPTAANSGVTFSGAGSYVLRVTVADGKGGSVASDVTVTVNPGSGVDPRADLNHDGVVNALDLQIVIANFGKTVGSPGCDARADANADGVVNALDLQIVIANFGKTVP